MSYIYRKLIIWVSISSFFLLSACGSGKPKPGDEAPVFTLQTLEGAQASLADYKGKLILINFWIDNCDACKKEMPYIDKYYREFKSEGEDFEILAVYVGNNKNASEQFKNDYDLSYPLLLDGQDVAFDQYQIDVAPTNYLVNHEGKVIRKIVGLVDKAQIEALLYNIKMNQ